MIMKPLLQYIPALQFQFVKSCRHIITAITELTTSLHSSHGSGTPCGCHASTRYHVSLHGHIYRVSLLQAQPYHGSGTPCGCHTSTRHVSPHGHTSTPHAP